jgi:hypothetical protein
VRARPGTRTRDADGRSEATPASKTGVIYSKSSRVVQSPENVLKFFASAFWLVSRTRLCSAPPQSEAPISVANRQSPDPSFHDTFPLRFSVSFFVTSSGPIDVPLSDKMFAVKERALAAWPEPSETFSKQVPPGPHAVKIILNGRVLDNGKTLRDVKVATDAVVTCHLMVQTKHPPPSRSMVRAAGKTSEPNPGCGCVVS